MDRKAGTSSEVAVGLEQRVLKMVAVTQELILQGRGSSMRYFKL